MKDFYSKCGCNCGHCPAFKENAKTMEDRKRCSEGWAKYLGAKLKPDSIQCEGCQAKDPWKGGNLLPDPSCYVRPCVVHTGIKNCAYCSAFPCVDLKNRIPGKDFRELTETRMGAKMPDEDYLSFVEPYEGVKHLEELREKLSPCDIADKAEVEPLKAPITEFPDELSLPRKELTGYRSLHELLSNILSGRAYLYVRQIILKRRKPHMLGILWVIGLYGEFQKGKTDSLVLDSQKHGVKKEYSWLVRKRDTAFFGSSKEAVKLLRGLGVNIDFERRDKNWRFTMSFDKKAGGNAALHALKVLAERLVEEHGEPVYVGNTRFKGDAFKLFLKADMRILK
jgi:hypothetical protein